MSGKGKPGNTVGDNRQMALSRRSFLDKGFYFPLANAVGELLSAQANAENILDICCGEGYYTDKLCSSFNNKSFYGFDISKEMVRLAAKRKCSARFFVANISGIPVFDNSIDFAFHLFAPFHANEFYRIMKPDGLLVTAIPGRTHLYGLKEILYDKPYENDEKLPDTGAFKVFDTIRVSYEITLNTREDIDTLLQMTPYFYHTPTSGLNRLSLTDTLTTPLDFVLVCCKKL